MRTKKQVVETTNERKELKSAFALWVKQSEKGNQFYTGKTEDGTQLIAFVNSNKKNPNQPDISVYENIKGEDGKYTKGTEEIATLWSNISDAGKRFLSGSTNEDEKLVGFYGELTDEKRPYIRVYYK